MENCNDAKCPVHGGLKVRGNVFTGRVISTKPAKTAIVERVITHYIPKYERYRKVKSRLYAYVPGCMEVKEGDAVKIGETRKLSKTKNFVVLEVLGKGESAAEEKK